MRPATQTPKRSAGAPGTFTEWLRGRSDAQLLTILRRRPDLGLPAPVDIATLASRASVRTSIARALDQLDAFTLRVLEVISISDDEPTVADIARWFVPADAPAVGQATQRLLDWALVWQDNERLRLAGATREVLGPYPCGLGRSAGELFSAVNDIALAGLLRTFGLTPSTQPRSGQSVAAAVLAQAPGLLAEATEAERSILTRLAQGPPIGVLTERLSGPVLSGDTSHDSPARVLVSRGLLIPIDTHTVELPREIALLLRDFPAGDVRAAPPELELTERGVAAVDSGGTTAVLESVRLAELLLDTLSDDPATQLRSGGVGVRDLRRLARVLAVEEAHVAALLEVCFEAGLLSSSSSVDPAYLPTTEFDTWLRQDTAGRWVVLADAWLSMTRLPSLIGERDERDKSIAALSADVERHSAPALRRQVLAVLAELSPGQAPTSVDEVLNRLSWLAPRRASASRINARSVLTEAAQFGLTGYGGITGYTRALLDGAETGAALADRNATILLEVALPVPVNEFLVQPDLTVVVPGPPTADLGRDLALIADLESTGGAAVYRVSATSVRRALDAGRSGSDLQDFFQRRSRTPMPQALQYLINDIATQHGRLRGGTATSYLRCDDVAMLDRVMAEPSLESLGLHRLAPTVVISHSAISILLERLRATGFAPAAEAADGSTVTLVPDSARVAARQHSRLARSRVNAVSDTQLADVLTRLRASEKLANAISNATTRVSQEVPGVTSASILQLLRTAVREELTIALGYVDDTGTQSQRTLLPISLGGGVVRGHDPANNDQLRSYALQRITTVSLLQD